MKILVRDTRDVEVDVQKFAIALAHANDIEQGRFMDLFARALKDACQGRAEMQVISMAQRFGDEGDWLVDLLKEGKDSL